MADVSREPPTSGRNTRETIIVFFQTINCLGSGKGGIGVRVASAAVVVEEAGVEICLSGGVIALPLLLLYLLLLLLLLLLLGSGGGGGD